MNVIARTQLLGWSLFLLAGVPQLEGQSMGGLIQPGDRVLLRVTGEPQLSDTFTVGEGPRLDLPVLGMVPLAGVARDSLEAHLTTFLAQYLNHPTVRAQVLLRLGVIGEVARPGFYAVPSDAVLEDLIMVAGGLSPDARFDKAKLVRDEDVLLHDAEVEHAVASGRTIDALGLRSGDALQIPRRPDPESRVRIVTALVALPIAIVALAGIF